MLHVGQYLVSSTLSLDFLCKMYNELYFAAVWQYVGLLTPLVNTRYEDLRASRLGRYLIYVNTTHAWILGPGGRTSCWLSEYELGKRCFMCLQTYRLLGDRCLKVDALAAFPDVNSTTRNVSVNTRSSGRDVILVRGTVGMHYYEGSVMGRSK